MTVKRVHWSSIDGDGPRGLPTVWCHTNTGDAVQLVFSSRAELKELVNTLTGALSAFTRQPKKGQQTP